ncbi:enoyl-CoA hydratase/isomerase family protein [Azospirillum sp. A1-3]|uniref:enoyl-CoA hydratase/isomerase family protein n=1 Tax=Azospirillum sp. A1-3 TaxID=185874 RepID=UPI0020773492|nr:enoyl-CoA hydratase/isomerase family protein [Azospirillum sp. A1-3]MCM8735243.1 enoyl-CoA hydratase/isomerase family protein [Azospirillum sp. A1-3]
MTVRFERRGTVGLITLAKPDRHNALAGDLVADLLATLDRPEAHQAAALVIAGDGPSFCAGADIGDLLDAGWMTPAPSGPTPMDLFERLDGHPRPTIAAVHGRALGGGFELSLCCDLVVAAADAVFALPELGLGVVPNTGLERLVQIAGPRHALDLILTRRRISAEEAAAMGLVSRVVPAGGAVDGAVELARAITDGAPPGAIATVKRAVRRAAPLDWPGVRAMLAEVPPGEWAEGLGAFRDRRRPDYSEFWRTSDA